MSQEVQYTEDNIRSLEWQEHIRLRPGMYIGKLGDGSSADDGIYILIKEVVDNSIDEFVMGGGKTFSSAYIDNVNDMGNIARQATIAQSALKVVYDQAVTARDQVSGVSLDEEAADLVRYQQAYQAAAKILQVASQLFDSVLQVR
jgi:flagellar hook-associated protein FlgK